MTRLLHLSDPHFGSEDPRIAEELLREIKELAPACVAISGDLTQRARRAQFRAARGWLDRLQLPTVVVPGNHDIPLYDVVRRFVSPRDRFHDYITAERMPVYVDDELAIVGVDTTMSLTTKHGRIRIEQADRAAEVLGVHPHKWSVLVAHHPFVVPPRSREPVVAGAEAALARLEQVGLDVILTGHLHIPHSEGAAGRNQRHTVINVHAGTCMSTRTRAEPNGYNQLQFDHDMVTIVHREWNGTRFVDGDSKSYRRGRVGGDERIVKIAETPPNPEVFVP